MTYNRIAGLAAAVLAAAVLIAPPLPVLAQSVNCVIEVRCIDPGDRSMINIFRQDCRVAAELAGFQAGMVISTALPADAGPPISNEFCVGGDGGMDYFCPSNEIDFECIGIHAGSL